MSNAVIGALRVNLGIDTAAFSNGLKSAQSGLQRFGAMAKTGLIALGAAATAAAGGLALAVKGTIDVADEMSKASQKIGIPIEELSRLKYAADLSGVSFESLQTSVGRLSKVMNEAKNGNQSAIDTFAQLGVSATNADGSLKSASQVMAEVADRFAAMPDGAEKTALAMELMGRSGANMIPMLNGGADALAKLMGEADSFGQVFTKEMGVNAELFNDNISRLQGAFGGLVAQLTTALLPHLASFTTWLVESTPAITNFIVKLVEFGAGIIDLGSTIIGFVTGAWAQFEAGWNRIIEIRNRVVAELASIGDEIGAAMHAVVAQMVAIGGQIMDGLWQGLKAKWESVKSGVSDLASGLVDSVKSTLGIHSPSRVMAEVGGNIVEGLRVGMEAAEGSATNVANSIADTLAGAFMSVIDGSKSVGDALKDLLKQVASMWVNSAFRSIFGGLGGGGGGFLSMLFGGFRANGGPVQAGRPYVVGERGPELMVPSHSGTVVANSNLKARSTHVTVGVAADGNGNLMPFVQSVAQREASAAAGQVASAVPSMISAHQKASSLGRPIR